MREGLHAPTERVPDEDLGRLRAYLDGQRPISLAVWVRHEHRGPQGTSYDHHSVLGMDEDAYAHADLAALERGLWEECPAPGWLDVLPLPEVQPLRTFGEVLWERGEARADGLDQLAYTLAAEAVEPPPGAAEAVAAAVVDLGSVLRVELVRVSLRTGGREVRRWLRFGVVEDERLPPGEAVERVSRALRGLDLGDSEVGLHRGTRPRPAGTILFERSAEGTA